MNEEKDFLGKEPVGRLLMRLALPTVTAQIINMLYNIVDRIYIGHIPDIGAMALTGVGVCVPLIMIVTAFAAFIGFGGAPRASIFMGKQDYKTAEVTLGNCFLVQIIISVLLTICLLLWNRDFLMAFGASENTIEYGVSYMNIYAIGTIFVQITLGMNSFITAQGFAKTGMFSVLIGAVANIVLDPIFIFAFQMGVQGAQPIISYNYGAGNSGRVKSAYSLLLKASLCYSVLLWALVMLFPGVFAGMFTSDPELLGFTQTALRIYMACLLLFGIQVACQMTFTSLGNAKASILVAVMRKFILLIPLIYLLPHILTSDQTTAVYLAEPIADFLAVSFTAVLFTFQFKKALREISPQNQKTAQGQ